MDGHRFDDLTRALAGGTSRRRVLKGFLGGVAGGAVAMVGARRTVAVARPVGATCIRSADCASGVCDSRTRRCVCLASQVTCNRACLDPATFQTDPANCGGCGRVCPGGVCTGGVCGVVLGVACTGGGECASGNCVDGVCCAAPSCAPLDSACQVGVCQPGFGGCATEDRADGTACDNGNACTSGDTCQAGVCSGGAPVACPSPTSCQASVACDPTTGACVAVDQPDGTLCGTDKVCRHDVCRGGACETYVPKPAGTACNDENSCTGTDACDGAGDCVGGAPVTCPPPDGCHGPGTCDTGTGVCGPAPLLPGTCFVGGVCSLAGDPDPANPCQVCDPAVSATAFSPRLNGAPCDDRNACTRTDTCQGGVCTGGNPVVCVASDACHDAGTCDPSTGVCSNPNAANGTSCDDGDGATCDDACQSGICTGGPCAARCADGRAFCGDACCPTGQSCVGGVCKTDCGATTCDPGTQICCASATCCDRATQACGSPAGTCVAQPLCDPAAVYLPASNTCCFAANVCGELCCLNGTRCVAAQCIAGGGGGGGGGRAIS